MGTVLRHGRFLARPVAQFYGSADGSPSGNDG
jgi:hypothetical protein